MGETKKVRRIIPYTREWERSANNIARDFAPPIYPCVECGGPVASGYCCTRCGSIDPEGNAEQRKEFQEWVNLQHSRQEELAQA